MKQAMIFAAGLGTRLKPLTDTMPKALVRVGGKPLIEHVLTKLKRAGFTRVVVNVHHFADQIEDYLKANEGFGLDVAISDERAALLDTGGGIKKALSLFRRDEPILVHNVDILSNADLSGLYEQARGSDAALLVSRRKSTRRLLFRQPDMHLCGWTNTETGERRGESGDISLAFSGIHVLAPGILPLFDSFPERFGIVDFYLKACENHRVSGILNDDLRLLDVGKPGTLCEADGFLKTIDN